MVKTVINSMNDLKRAAEGVGSGTSGANIPEILAKMGTFARAVATEKYGIDQNFSFDSGLIFPLIGINHLVTRGIFQPLERSINSRPDPDAGASASGTADVALKDMDKFFENAELHFNKTTLEAVKDCVVISANVTNAEKNGQPIKLNSEQLRTAELALRGIKDAVAKIAQNNPDVSGVSNFANDMEKISTHYNALAQKLLPALSNTPRPGQK